jgi:hypothetical protein
MGRKNSREQSGQDEQDLQDDKMELGLTLRALVPAEPMGNRARVLRR